MGNGQHRNRRGARPRPGPHKHGGAGNPGRATTQLIPPVAPASAASETTPTDRGADEDAGEHSPEPASALPVAADHSVTPGALAAEQEAAEGQDAPPSAHVETNQEARWHGADDAPQPSLVEASPAEEFTAEANMARTSNGSVPASRSRFDRFYTPGQGSRPERPERPERIAPAINPVLPPIASPPPSTPRRTERVERAPVAREPMDDDDGPDYTGPRADVRGNVGELIDSLHEVFARDRAIATQGGAARCGVCYLHFPVGELIYRDVEGFYVCESCAHALGSARVPMVRRQQRQ